VLNRIGNISITMSTPYPLSHLDSVNYTRSSSLEQYSFTCVISNTWLARTCLWREQCQRNRRGGTGTNFFTFSLLLPLWRGHIVTHIYVKKLNFFFPSILKSRHNEEQFFLHYFCYYHSVGDTLLPRICFQNYLNSFFTCISYIIFFTK